MLIPSDYDCEFNSERKKAAEREPTNVETFLQ